MGMTDLGDPYGDSADAGRRISEPVFGTQILFLIGFSEILTDGFYLKNSDRSALVAGLSFLLQKILYGSNTHYI